MSIHDNTKFEKEFREHSQKINDDFQKSSDAFMRRVQELSKQHKPKSLIRQTAEASLVAAAATAVSYFMWKYLESRY